VNTQEERVALPLSQSEDLKKLMRLLAVSKGRRRRREMRGEETVGMQGLWRWQAHASEKEPVLWFFDNLVTRGAHKFRHFERVRQVQPSR